MTKAKVALIVLLAGVAVAGAGLYVSAGPEQMTIDEAADTGVADVAVTGVDLESIQFTVSGSRAMQVVIPAGFLLASNDPGTQNMMTAEAVVVDLQGTPESPDFQTVTVPVYCVNHSLEVPTPVSSFSLGTVTEETEPVQRLAQCLAGLTADHRQKQWAIWSVSDDYANMDVDAFVEKGLEQVRSKMQGLGPDGVADLLQRENPDAPPDVIALVRTLSADQLAGVIDRLLPDLMVAKREEFEQMRVAARPLLEQCGYDVETLPMFAGSP